MPAPRNPGYWDAARVSSSLHSSKSASRPGATRRATVTVTGSGRAACPSLTSPDLRLPVPLLERVADVHEEERRRRPVERPMVVDQTDDARRVDRDGVADGHRSALDAVGAENARVGLVDDRERGV